MSRSETHAERVARAEEMAQHGKEQEAANAENIRRTQAQADADHQARRDATRDLRDGRD